MDIVYDEKTGKWGVKKEPYMTLEIETEEDWNFLQKAVAFYKEHHKEGEEK